MIRFHLSLNVKLHNLNFKYNMHILHLQYIVDYPRQCYALQYVAYIRILKHYNTYFI